MSRIIRLLGLLSSMTLVLGITMCAPAHAMTTVPTAAGIDITVSEEFAGPAQSVIADAVASGQHFRRIHCYSHAGTHVRGSNHHTGNACDAYPAIRASVIRRHGLRSGCDFHDCTHFDNATNVGGIDFWNSVKHRGIITVSANRRHHHHRRHRHIASR